MPVYKYHTFAEAEQALWTLHPDQEYFKRIADLREFANALSPITYPRGIFKFKTIEEANHHRERIELERAKQQCLQRQAPDEDHAKRI